MEVEVESEVGEQAEVEKLSTRKLLNATSAISLAIFDMSVQIGKMRLTMLNSMNTKRCS